MTASSTRWRIMRGRPAYIDHLPLWIPSGPHKEDCAASDSDLPWSWASGGLPVVPELVRQAVRLAVPVFGVCLGLQGIVGAARGGLGVLDYPMHGKPSSVRHNGTGVFEGLPERFQVGRYHSLFAIREALPACLEVTAESDDGVIMALRHRELPVEAVQFHLNQS